MQNVAFQRGRPHGLRDKLQDAGHLVNPGRLASLKGCSEEPFSGAHP